MIQGVFNRSDLAIGKSVLRTSTDWSTVLTDQALKHWASFAQNKFTQNNISNLLFAMFKLISSRFTCDLDVTCDIWVKKKKIFDSHNMF